MGDDALQKVGDVYGLRRTSFLLLLILFRI
jgi:hypothetical protein